MYLLTLLPGGTRVGLGLFVEGFALYASRTLVTRRRGTGSEAKMATAPLQASHPGCTTHGALSSWLEGKEL
jgi:hypothetical protein